MIRLLLLALALPALHAQRPGPALADGARYSFEVTFYGKDSSSFYINHIQSGVSFCFSRPFQADSKQDCFIIKAKDIEIRQMQQPKFNAVEFTTALPGFPIPGTRYYEFQLKIGQTFVGVLIFKNTRRAAAIVRTSLTLGVEVIVNGNSLSKSTLSKTTGLDFSSCRASDGSVVNRGRSVQIDCVKQKCSNTFGLSSEQVCSTDTVCVNNQCRYKLSCTATGPTVIDFKGRTTTIRDRCLYSLLSTTVFGGLSVTANYTERGRKDVSFLDTIGINLGSTLYYVGQGGAVKSSDGQEQTIPGSGLKAGSLTINKWESGVVATVIQQSLTLILSFDGIAAQIFIQGPGTTTLGLGSLCSNAPRALDFRTKSGNCDQILTQDSDGTIDCNAVKQQCNVLKTPQFSSCQSLLSPEPFVQVCMSTLCRYPDDDKLICRYLEVYSKACTALHGQTVNSWRDSVTCPSNPQIFCKDKTCVDHEYCARAPSGDGYQCNCKNSFGDKYRPNNKLGDEAVCDKDSGKASLANCLLLEKGIDYTTLHLNDQTCKGTLEDGMVNFEFNRGKMCNTVVKEEGKGLMYENRIKSATSSGPIIRQDEVNIPFKCTYAGPPEQRVSIKVISNSVLTGLEAGDFKYTLQMTTYSDQGLKNRLTSATLNQRVWVALVTSLDGNVAAMVVESCWATTTSDPNSKPRYDLIKNSCPNVEDKTVAIKENGKGSSSVLSFNIFQFSDGSTDVFLHCNVRMCTKTGKSCIPKCPANRRRRSVDVIPGSPALISMSWSR